MNRLLLFAGGSALSGAGFLAGCLSSTAGGRVSAAEQLPASETLASESRVAQIMRYGFPGFDNVRSYRDFVVSYDRRTRVPHWVFEHLTAESLRPPKDGPPVDRQLCQFREDESIHEYFRSTNADYKKSGYDRGHMACAGNHKASQHLIDETFHLTNIAPQVGAGFNRNIWNTLEKHTRSLLKTSSNVFVCTGPLFLARRESDGRNYVRYEVIGPNSVAVPTHFFKVLVYEVSAGSKPGDERYALEAYVMPNRVIDDATPLRAFQVPLDSIERQAGLLLFERLPRRQLVSINGRKL